MISSKSQRGKCCSLSLGALIAAACAASASADTIDLTPQGNDQGTINGAIFSDHFVQPAGTGVFKPFLSLQAKSNSPNIPTTDKRIEQAYNTDGFSHLYMDADRPQWNNLVRVGDLANIDIGGTKYFGFVLDANEPGAGKSLLSVDNVRIYTRNSDNTTAVGNNLANLDQLGTLRWSLNDPTAGSLNGFNAQNWVSLDSAQENQYSNSNGGSGKADMILYVPADNFKDALPTDYLFFYNLNGVHFGSDAGLAAESGYEEWQYISKTVPDGGATIGLIGLGMVGLGAMRRKLS
jgi:hypothetical protein